MNYTETQMREKIALNFPPGSDMPLVKEFLDEQDIRYRMRDRQQRSEHDTINKQLDINDNVLAALYFSDDSKFIKIYYYAYFIYNVKDNKLKSIVFDVLYKGP